MFIGDNAQVNTISTIRGFGWAYKRRGLYPGRREGGGGGLISGK